MSISTVFRPSRTNAAAGHATAVALVPAYNEEDIIERTIESLMHQTFPFEYILVIANNCTDNTVQIVERLQEKYGHEMLRLLVMPKNDAMKAGALNYGFEMLDPQQVQYVFSMDSDTIVDEKILEEGIKKFLREPKTGGICSAYRTLSLDQIKENPTFKERLLWRLQNIEFSLANAWRIEFHKSARVLPGVSSLYRAELLREIGEDNTLRRLLQAIAKMQVDNQVRRTIEKMKRRGRLLRAVAKLHFVHQLVEERIEKRVLAHLSETVTTFFVNGTLPEIFRRLQAKGFVTQEVAEYYGDGLQLVAASRQQVLQKLPKVIDKIYQVHEVWVINDQVEDYTLTLDIKDRGWDAKSYHDMVSWSDVPLTFRVLWKQRSRWYSGTIDTLRRRGLQRHSRYEVFTVALLMVNLLMRVLLLAGYTSLVIASIQIQWISPFLLIILLAIVTTRARLIRYGDRLDWVQKLIVYTLVVNELYATYREVIYAYSVWLSYFRPKRGW